MNNLILTREDYTFTASTGVVTISADHPITKEHTLIITNTITNDIIYNFGCPGFGGVIDERFNTINLEIDTSAMNDVDNLQIVIYTENSPVGDQWGQLFAEQATNLETLTDILDELKIQTKLLRKIYG